MSTIDRISIILKRMTELAHRGKSSNVGESLGRAAARFERDHKEGAHTIVGMYGGMGSLNDVILYEGNKPLCDENEEFDVLRTELYELCQSLRN